MINCQSSKVTVRVSSVLQSTLLTQTQNFQLFINSNLPIELISRHSGIFNRHSQLPGTQGSTRFNLWDKYNALLTLVR